MAYTKTAWVNDSTPSIDATNLNNLETQYETAQTDFAPISGTGSLTVSAWSTNTSATGFSVSATFATSPSIPRQTLILLLKLRELLLLNLHRVGLFFLVLLHHLVQ
jgi:hypothetical protein